MKTTQKSLTANEVKHVAKLAKITLTEKEVTKFQNQLSHIMNYIEELDDVDTASVDPTSQTTGLENVTREDLMTSERSLSPKRATSGSNKINNDYFVVDLTLTKRSI